MVDSTIVQLLEVWEAWINAYDGEVLCPIRDHVRAPVSVTWFLADMTGPAVAA
jgi:hypothetical protein